jgi:hypothetical protein
MRGIGGALFGSAGARQGELTRWDAAIRARRATGRRIGVLQVTPDAGGSTIATQLVLLAASRRTEPVLAIDVSGGAAGLGGRLGAAGTGPSPARADARTTAEAVTGLAAGPGWFALHPAADASGTVGTWLTEATPIVRFFEVVVTDFGMRHPLVDLAACAALCDVVCLVARADRAGAELARSIAMAIHALPEQPDVVIALADRARVGDTAARVVAAHSPHRVVRVPFDAGLRADDAPRSAATRRALVELAALLIDGDTATAEDAA